MQLYFTHLHALQMLDDAIDEELESGRVVVLELISEQSLVDDVANAQLRAANHHFPVHNFNSKICQIY